MVEQSVRTPSPQSQSSVFNPDRSINADVLAANYGLRVEDAQKQVNYGKWKGSMAEMLDNAACPVGGRVKNAFEKDGIGGVLKTFDTFRTLGVDIRVSQETIDMHQNGFFKPAEPSLEEQTNTPTVIRDSESTGIEDVNNLAEDGEQKIAQPILDTIQDTTLDLKQEDPGIVPNPELSISSATVRQDISQDKTKSVDPSSKQDQALVVSHQANVYVLPREESLSNTEHNEQAGEAYGVVARAVVAPNVKIDEKQPLGNVSPRQTVISSPEFSLRYTPSEPSPSETAVMTPIPAVQEAALSSNSQRSSKLAEAINTPAALFTMAASRIGESAVRAEQKPKRFPVDVSAGVPSELPETEQQKKRTENLRIQKNFQSDKQEKKVTRQFEQPVPAMSSRKEERGNERDNRSAQVHLHQEAVAVTKKRVPENVRRNGYRQETTPVVIPGELIKALNSVGKLQTENVDNTYQRERRRNQRTESKDQIEPPVIIAISEGFLDTVSRLVKEYDSVQPKKSGGERVRRAARQEAANENRHTLAVTRNERKITIFSSKGGTENRSHHVKPPIMTLTELNDAFIYMAGFIQIKERGALIKYDKNKKPGSEAEVIISAEMMEFVKAILLQPSVSDRKRLNKTRSTESANVQQSIASHKLENIEASVATEAEEKTGLGKEWSITFLTNDENKKKLTVDSKQLLKSHELLKAFMKKDNQGKGRYQEGGQMGSATSFMAESGVQELYNAGEFMLSEGVAKVLENGKGNGRRRLKDAYTSKTEKSSKEQFVILSSKGREIRIEINKLRKIMELYEKEKMANSDSAFNPNEQAPEEIIQEDNQSASDGNKLFDWFYCQILFYIIFSLQGAEVKDLWFSSQVLTYDT